MLEGLGRTGSPRPAESLCPLAGDEYRPLLPSQDTSLRILTTALSPLDYRKWRRKPWYWRLLKAFKVSGGQHEPRGAPPRGTPIPAGPWGSVPPGLCSGDGGTVAVGMVAQCP